MIRILIDGDDHEWQNHLINKAFEDYGSDVDMLLIYGDPQWSIEFSGDTSSFQFIIDDLKNNNNNYHNLDKQLFVDSIHMYKNVFNKFAFCYKDDKMIEDWKSEGSYIRM